MRFTRRVQLNWTFKFKLARRKCSAALNSIKKQLFEMVGGWLRISTVSPAPSTLKSRTQLTLEGASAGGAGLKVDKDAPVVYLTRLGMAGCKSLSIGSVILCLVRLFVRSLKGAAAVEKTSELLKWKSFSKRCCTYF